jgi:hypothetical protein
MEFVPSLLICAKSRLQVSVHMSNICVNYILIIISSGFGDYLHQIDPRYTWSEHLHHILIFCQVHVRRAFRKRFGEHEATQVLDMIFEATSKAELQEIMKETTKKWPETTHWVQSKQVDWILAGLSSEHSKIPIQWRRNAPHHTGVSESRHFVDNEAVGRKLPILTAIIW